MKRCDSTDSEDEEKQVANICFMVNEDQVQQDETEYESLDEVNYTNLLEYFKNKLAQALIKCF